jgi:hypothetical protein
LTQLPAIPIHHHFEDSLVSDPVPFTSEYHFAHTCQAFQSLVTRLPLWESLLLQHVHFGRAPTLLPSSIHNIYRSPGKRLFAIVQNWYKDNTASFGWTLFSTNGESIAASYGPSPGPPSRSHANAWGILSLLRFFNHLPKSQNQDILFPPVTILHRNPRVIHIMRDRPNWSTVYCNETLSPVWDIMEQCFTSTEDLDIQLTWQTLMDFKKHYNRLKYPLLFSFDSRVDQLKRHTKSSWKNFINGSTILHFSRAAPAC